jgi:hypothetical protein
MPLGNLLVFSPLGLSFVDDFTGGAPIGFLSAKLLVEIPAGSNTFVPTGVRGLFTKSGILAYPNLGRRGRVPTPAEPAKNFQVVITAQYYDPLYPGPAGSTGVAFSVTPYDNDTDFAAVGLRPTMVTLPLLPRGNYPFPGGIPFLRGNSEFGPQKPVVALVSASEPVDDTCTTKKQTRVMTDPLGAFRLPLRWGDKTQQTTITATNLLTGKSSSINMTLPYDVTNPKTFTIPNP